MRNVPFGPAEMRRRVRAAVLLAGAVMLAGLPMFMGQFDNFGGTLFKSPPAPPQLLKLSIQQSLMLFALALPCALVGFLYAERLRLPGLGVFADLRAWLPLGLAAGAATTPLGYWLLDRELLALLPQLYPRTWHAALGDMLGMALSQEVLLRFGLLTIAIYLWRWRRRQGHPWPVILLLAAFATLATYLFLDKFGLPAQLGPIQFGLALLLTFIPQYLYGEIYVRWGLLAACCAHFGLNVRLLAYALWA